MRPQRWTNSIRVRQQVTVTVVMNKTPSFCIATSSTLLWRNELLVYWGKARTKWKLFTSSKLFRSTLEVDKSAGGAVATGIWKPDGATETLNLLNFEWDFFVTVLFCINWRCLSSRQIQGNFTFVPEVRSLWIPKFTEQWRSRLLI